MSQVRPGLLGVGDGDRLVQLLERDVSVVLASVGYQLVCGRYVVMVAMVLHSLNSLLSAFATFSQNGALLLTSLILR